MGKKVYLDDGAEREATNIGKKFMNSTDVVGDMSRAYGTDLSAVRLHTDDSAARQAAERGVDVRILMPGIPDKKTVYAVTRSYYAGLARQGVRIFEYTPGFCHAKQMICDGTVASIGTSNLDYRSLYLHFECGTCLYGKAVAAVKADIENTLELCQRIRAEDCRNSLPVRGVQAVLRLFAPLM